MRSRFGLAACGTAIVVMSPLALADEDDETFIDRTPIDCVSTTRIRSTEVIDDRTIVFYLRGGRVYSNILDHDCPSLLREDLFAYEARGGRLCSSDFIRVLPRSGFGIGPSCGLGDFHPITLAEAELLESDPDAIGEEQRGSVEMRPIELPDDEPVDAAGSADPAAGEAAEGDAGEAVERAAGSSTAGAIEP